MSWLQKILPPKIKSKQSASKSVPEGLWSKCHACEAVLYRTDLRNNVEVCPKCGYHHPISAQYRLDILLDTEGRFSLGQNIQPVDGLKFKDTKTYTTRLTAAKEQTGEEDALVVMQGSVKTIPVVAAAFEFKFIGGSMGAVVGERFVRGVAAAIEANCAFICIAASGGARMQEGLSSLMQMAKTCAILTKLADKKLPFISILTDPTMGGVSASFAFLGDVVVAEPNALIGFAGPRVIQQTVRETLPEGFQRAEFLLEKGAIDMIVDRRQIRQKVAQLLTLLQRHPAV